MGVCGQGGNPDSVSYHCRRWYLYLCHRIGCRHWCIDATLRTHFIVVDNIHCRLSTHVSLRSQGMVPQQYLFRYFTPPLCPMLRTTCRSLKYYNKFASRVRSLVPHTTSCGSYLNLLASSCFILRPSPLHSVFAVDTIASCALATRPMFLEFSSHTAHTVLSSSLECCQKLRNQLSYTSGLVWKRVDTVFIEGRLVGSQPRMLENVLSHPPRMMRHQTRTGWGDLLTPRQHVATSEAVRRVRTAHSNIQRFASQHQPLQVQAHSYQISTKKKNNNNDAFQTYVVSGKSPGEMSRQTTRTFMFKIKVQTPSMYPVLQPVSQSCVHLMY